ncbi:AAA family ATPase [Pseudomonas sp. RIT623]|uniref:AAA family ATPase n=1 Tax=Pseudomonas sp. RIT623 TaxID=2559075 RepID=UPI00106FBF3E|nr:AAA family ATPase [Pseudomonas sp. RIT623]TFF41655.1 hypothetical protein E3U47_07850 [Pseudomonas sp. RIT623]
MMLIHLYIHEHKAIRRLNVPINGRFACRVSPREAIEVEECAASWDFYNGYACSAIIGVNGSGKSTVLDFISAFDKDSESVLLAIFFDAKTDTYNFCYANSTPELFGDVRADKKFRQVLKVERFFAHNNVQVVSINTLPPASAFLAGVSEAKEKAYIKNLISGEVLKSEGRKKKYFDQIFSYLRNYPYAERLDEPCFGFSFPGAPQGMWDKLYAVLDRERFEQAAVSDVMRLNTISFELEDCTAHEVFHCLVRTNIPSILNLISKRAFGVSASFDLLAIAFFKYYVSPQGEAIHHKVELAVREVLRDMRLADEKLAAQGAIDELENNLLEQLWSIWDSYQALVEVILYQCYDGEHLNLKQVKVEDYGTITSLIDAINKLPRNLSAGITWGWQGVSSGELAKMHIFSQLYGYLERAASSARPIILIDEADLYLHPEWQRTFLSDMLRMFGLIEAYKPGFKPQLVISTHSPIIVSDFLARDITSINRDEFGGFTLGKSSGFGCSVVDIYMQDMHLSSTFGEHARRRLTHLIEAAKNNSLSEKDRELIAEVSSETVKGFLLSYDKNQ